MTIPTFAPPVAPSPGGTRKPVVNVLKAQFGDGYSQSRPRGLNHIRRTVTLRWDGLGTEEMQALDGFFTRHGGYVPFLYQPYGFAETARWVCGSWESENGPPWRFVAELEEDFGVAK